MTSLMGEQLLEKKTLSQEQLHAALEYQRINGGRLGNSIAALGFLDTDQIEAFFKTVPRMPKNLSQTGLSQSFIDDLIIKHALNLREFSLADMGNGTKLSLAIINDAVERMRKAHLMVVKSAEGLSRRSYVFNLSEAGENRAKNLLQVSMYTGPAPVSFDDYKNICETQTIKSIFVDEQAIADACSNIIITKELLQQLGPAVCSGKAIFLYGPPGNGKTTIAEIIGNVLNDAIYIPYAIEIGGQIITIYDQGTHVAVNNSDETEDIDKRWIKIKRPMIMTGGEMTLKGLDLDFNPISKFYEAPLQVKANNGIFIVDDFGRQQVDPQVLLNRWIVPLERRKDFLTLHTGMKIEIPFDQLVIFSTNLEPKKLADEAFLRRIRYKIKIDHPEIKEYKLIFKRVCESNGIPFDQELFVYLINELYGKNRVRLNACHCRDLLDWIIDNAHYRNKKPVLSREALAESWKNYFVDLS
ncbi:MAG: ATPase [Desulfobacula sp.]|jgi:energy-coupling factor transporter ATP-binding protein EcfA2|nr:ATPase [Desulfobacula sp.]